MPLGLEPALEAIIMDISDCASTLASQDEWVVLSLLLAPAESALNWVFTRIYDVSCRFNDLSFFQLLVVEFLRR